MKEIELDTLADIFYKMKHGYLGYDTFQINLMFFDIISNHINVKNTFIEFVEIFRSNSYRII